MIRCLQHCGGLAAHFQSYVTKVTEQAAAAAAESKEAVLQPSCCLSCRTILQPETKNKKGEVVFVQRKNKKKGRQPPEVSYNFFLT